MFSKLHPQMVSIEELYRHFATLVMTLASIIMEILMQSSRFNMRILLD